MPTKIKHIIGQVNVKYTNTLSILSIFKTNITSGKDVFNSMKIISHSLMIKKQNIGITPALHC